MVADGENLERIFPVYLTDASKERLAECLRDRADNHDYYTTAWNGPDQPLQGDGWQPLTLFDFVTGHRSVVPGIVVSNSCDIDQANASMRPRNVLFAPLIRLETYETLLRENGIDAGRVEAHLQAVRRQEKTEIFYVPAGSETPECLVMLDDMHSQPLSAFMDAGDKKRLFRFNNFGFYMLLMKLSIHFTRFGEKLDRGGADTERSTAAMPA